MVIAPKLRAARLPQADPGALFLVRDDTGSYVALAVKGPHEGDRLVLVLGPPSPEVPEVPVLTNFSLDTVVVSFGKEYTLRLPCDVKAWLPAGPRVGQCVVLSGDKVYVRGRYYRQFNQAIHVYVGIEDGLLVVNRSGEFAHPSGRSDDCAYSVDCAFLTVEKDPRVILSLSGASG
jgi:hypothetical protein